VLIRQDAAATVTSWAAPDQLAQVCLGAAASVSADWMSRGQTATGTVTRIGQAADYPPTGFATDEVHLTRAVQITVTLSGTGDQPSLPPGAPVDLHIRPPSAGCTSALASSSDPMATPASDSTSASSTRR
jgi:hypothetical protein